MSDSRHTIQHIATFRVKIETLGGMDTAEARVGVVTGLALMEQAKQARIANLIDWYAMSDDGSSRVEVSRAIEEELGLR
jgi:hypothetical protein